jgi:hypothetical protein
MTYSYDISATPSSAGRLPNREIYPASRPRGPSSHWTLRARGGGCLTSPHRLRALAEPPPFHRCHDNIVHKPLDSHVIISLANDHEYRRLPVLRLLRCAAFMTAVRSADGKSPFTVASTFRVQIGRRVEAAATRHSGSHRAPADDCLVAPFSDRYNTRVLPPNRERTECDP